MWLAFGAHPDDVELAVGGILLCIKKYSSGKTGIIHLTSGEKGSFGSKETREEEAKEAAKLLKVDYLNFLGLDDTKIKDEPESAQKIADFIKQLNPEVILLPYGEDYHHPDHNAAAKLLKRALFYSNLGKSYNKTKPTPFLLYYLQHSIELPKPTFIVDVSEVIEDKLKVLKSYKSQFESTPLSKVIDFTLAKMKYWGSLIGKDFGEALFSEVPIPISFNLHSFPLKIFE